MRGSRCPPIDAKGGRPEGGARLGRRDICRRGEGIINFLLPHTTQLEAGHSLMGEKKPKPTNLIMLHSLGIAVEKFGIPHQSIATCESYNQSVGVINTNIISG